MKKLFVIAFAFMLVACGGGYDAINDAHASGTSFPSTYNANSVAITGGTITGITGFSYSSANSSQTGGGTLTETAFNTVPGGTYKLNSTMLYSATAPTMASGFCGLGSAVSNINGTATFTIATGTGACGASGVITMPAATTAWNCTWSWSSFAVPDPDKTFEFSATSTSVTMYAYTASTGVASVFVINKKINVNCVGY